MKNVIISRICHVFFHCPGSLTGPADEITEAFFTKSESKFFHIRSNRQPGRAEKDMLFRQFSFGKRLSTAQYLHIDPFAVASDYK